MEETRIVRPGQDEWPSPDFDEIPDAPTHLYLRGKPLRYGKKVVAVVGTRRPTAAGIEAARMITRGLVQAGFAIVSGLAVGIDSVAHRTAIDLGGYTVGVLGCGCDLIYPKRNASLKARIERLGTIVSEYPDGTESAGWRFPERNRIIAGLVKAVVIVEGSYKSGALITARYGLDYGKDVFAIPGSIRNPMSTAPNELIRTGNAYLATDIKHITDHLAPGLVYDVPQPQESLQVPLEDGEARILTLLDDAPVSTDFVCRETGMSVGETAINLSRLEVRNFVRRARGGYELTDAGCRVRTGLETTS